MPAAGLPKRAGCGYNGCCLSLATPAEMPIFRSAADDVPQGARPHQTRRSIARGLLDSRLTNTLLVVIAYSAVIVTILLATKSFQSEFCGYPDEPAHYANGLLIREYLAHGIFSQPPMKFAIDYYLHYPKVTLGHWPPLFHVIEGLWMTVFSGSRASVLAMMGCWTLMLAVAIQRAASRFGPLVSFVIGLLFLLLPATQEQLTMTMTEIPLALFSLLAVLSWARYLEEGRRREAVWFGAWASCAILVKGDAWALAPAAALSMVLAGRLGRVKEWAFWAPVAMVGVTCLPYYLLTGPWSRIGWFGGTSPTWSYTRVQVAQLGPIFTQVLGWPPTIALLLGAAGYVLISRYRADRQLATVFSFLVAAAALEAVVPAGIDGSRKIYCFVPECLLVATLGLDMVARWMPRYLGAHRLLLVVAAVLAAFMIFDFRVVERYNRGFRDVAGAIHARFPSEDIGILVSSGGPFEGALVAEMATAFRYPSVYVLRAAVVLADTDWAGPMHLLFDTPETLEAEIERLRIRVLVVHEIEGPFARLSVLLERAASARSADWSLLFDRTVHTDRGTERLRAWDLQNGAVKPDLSPVIKRLRERRLAPAHVTMQPE